MQAAFQKACVEGKKRRLGAIGSMDHGLTMQHDLNRNLASCIGPDQRLEVRAAIRGRTLPGACRPYWAERRVIIADFADWAGDSLLAAAVTEAFRVDLASPGWCAF
jgi:hypothetical protein